MSFLGQRVWESGNGTDVEFTSCGMLFYMSVSSNNSGGGFSLVINKTTIDLESLTKNYVNDNNEAEDMFVQKTMKNGYRANDIQDAHSYIARSSMRGKGNVLILPTDIAHSVEGKLIGQHDNVYYNDYVLENTAIVLYAGIDPHHMDRASFYINVLHTEQQNTLFLMDHHTKYSAIIDITTDQSLSDILDQIKLCPREAEPWNGPKASFP